MRLPLLAALFMLLLSTFASAGPAADLLTKHLEAGTLSDGIATLEPMIKGGDKEALAARGTLKFLAGVEHLGQAFHRHGLEVATGNPMMQLPVLRMPVPPNSNPEQLDYLKFRKIFETLVADLDAAELDLAAVEKSEVKLPINLALVRFDLSGDGKAEAYESLGIMLGEMMRGEQPTSAVIAFDTADVYWLRGYAKFLGAFAQFFLAHDFETAFNKTFHMYFPRAGLPLAEKLARPDPANPYRGDAIGDGVAFLHLINWKTVEPARAKDARLRLMAMASLSRESWAAARAETDNDREWLPNAKQASAFGIAPVTDEVIDGWLAVMAEFEAVLDGRKLLPHWRFNEGINLKRLLDEGTNFDLVLLAAGADALPWLEPGPVSDSTSWNNLMRVFQGNFLGYALWFN
jgi:hypothetical protein